MLLVLAGCVITSCSSLPKTTGSKEKAAAVLETIHKVNRYWQTAQPDHGWSFWDNAVYHTGNMEVVRLTGDENYRRYSEAWAVKNDWKGATATDPATWKYSYGEKPEYVLFGDWQICFQTYIDLYNLAPAEHKIARAKEVMSYQVKTGKNDYWWWADGLYMVMPVMVKMYKLTGDAVYLDKLYSWFSYANSIMYDSTEHIYYRDAKYIFPKHATAAGKKDFWARGNGWVFAGLAKVLQDLPVTDLHRDEYISTFRKMAVTLKQYQQPEGYWTRSIMDSAQSPGYETSGTAFFTYGYFWGINNGYLDRKSFLPVAEKGWNYLITQALQPDGKIGYVQPIGERAIPGQVVNKQSATNFGVGAFLLAACERYRFLGQK
jgi:rhamnogalacturonyl hydrolase YesR